MKWFRHEASFGRNFVFSLLLALFAVTGCNNYRFVPSHGGGKRFDEEERAVSTAVRNAVAQVDVSRLASHKVNVAVVALAHNGGGTVTLPGFNNASASYSSNSSNNTLFEATDRYWTYMPHSSDSWNVNLGYSPNLSAWPTVFGTDQDLTYLESAMQMKLRVSGAIVTVPDPEYVLYVLVDVLGTNRSKQDSFIIWNDTLTASCELTYYVLDTKTSKVLFGAKRASAEASYEESSIFGFAGYQAQRSQCRTVPNPMPTDANDEAISAYRTKVVHTVPDPAVKTIHVDPLAQKLRDAQSYVEAGNTAAAEKLYVEIRAANPNYAGLDALNSRITTAKASAAKPPTPAPTPPPAPAPAPAPTPTPSSAPPPAPTAAPPGPTPAPAPAPAAPVKH